MEPDTILLAESCQRHLTQLNYILYKIFLNNKLSKKSGNLYRDLASEPYEITRFEKKILTSNIMAFTWIEKVDNPDAKTA